ncbi:hypothetical protein PAHAL_8G077900 [Panicum hallii]|uniref:Uncharacterized protein n=1 Tax=Panicum hallii TaxID=206008 RepID=A0A2S3IDD9_9POAL|nr:large proline-rich protein BAG6-like [Panicum hallii]PAN41894.1 hypothetical protein PAHAL_8G077900 [Panicum hallii]
MSTYFVGHPTAYTAAEPGTRQEPQVNGGAEKKPVSTQAPGTDGYFVGHPVTLEGKQPAPAPPPPPPPPPARNNGSGFLAKWTSCLFGDGASAEQ